MLLTTRAPFTSKTLARGRYNYANVDAHVQRRQRLRERRACGGVRKELGEHVAPPAFSEVGHASLHGPLGNSSEPRRSEPASRKLQGACALRLHCYHPSHGPPY